MHTPVDLGTFERRVRQLHQARGGTGAWQDRVKQIGQLWRSIRTELLRLTCDFSRMLLYQDGLPVCGKEDLIVEELARAGSANHRLLLELKSRGATLVGTESPELLIEEYELNRQLLLEESPRPQPFAAEVEKLSRELLDRRDAFIARRIDETLGAGQIGCLFLGLMHPIRERLPPDIALDRLPAADRS